MAIDLLKYMIWKNGTGGGSASYEKTVGPAPIISISDAKAKPAKSLIVGMEPIQAGSGDPSPDNIRPISGRTGVTVWDDPAYGGLVTWNQRCSNSTSTSSGGGVTYTNNEDGTWTLTENGTGTNRKQIGSPSIAAGHIIYMRHGADIDGSSSTFSVCISNSGGSLQSSFNKDGGLFRVGSNGMNQFSIRTFSSFVPPEGGLVLTPQLFDLTLMFGEEKAEEIYAMEGGRDYFLDLFPKHYYEYNNSGEQKTVSEVNGDPYRSVNVDWTSEAGTVYGGTVDVVSGLLTVDRVIDTITKDSTWYGFNTGTGNSSAVVQLSNYLNVKYVDGASSFNGAISSTGREAQNYWTGGRENEIPNYGDMCFAYSQTGQLRFHRLDVANITDLASFKANFPDTTICYYLATPQTYQLTPQQIQMLKGANVLWSDADELTLTYLAKKETQSLGNSAPLLFGGLNLGNALNDTNQETPQETVVDSVDGDPSEEE